MKIEEFKGTDFIVYTSLDLYDLLLILNALMDWTLCRMRNVVKKERFCLCFVRKCVLRSCYALMD